MSQDCEKDNSLEDDVLDDLEVTLSRKFKSSNCNCIPADDGDVALSGSELDDLCNC